MLAHAANLPRGPGVFPADNTHPAKESTMFAINLQRPLVTFAVIAGLLAVAGPASASTIPDGERSLVTGGIVTDNKDPDKIWTDPTTSAPGAVVAADFNYSERARA